MESAITPLIPDFGHCYGSCSIIGIILIIIFTLMVLFIDKKSWTFLWKNAHILWHNYLVGKSRLPEEIDRSNIYVGNTIGSGNFGIVSKGLLRPVMPVCDFFAWLMANTVAIKMPNNVYTQQQDFLDEISMMRKFHHPNVVSLKGYVTKSKPFMMVTEYMRNGSLKDYLQTHRFDWNLSKNLQLLIKILRDIANGLLYVADMGYVHRDVAARNVLLNDELTPKVSDFGLCRSLEDVDCNGTPIHVEKGGSFPILWTAPEARTYGIYSSSSDVYSFGVLMWEVLTNGKDPYENMINDAVNYFKQLGNLLQPLMFRLYYMMIRCWDVDRKNRPTFKQVVAQLDAMLLE